MLNELTNNVFDDMIVIKGYYDRSSGVSYLKKVTRTKNHTKNFPLPYSKTNNLLRERMASFV